MKKEQNTTEMVKYFSLIHYFYHVLLEADRAFPFLEDDEFIKIDDDDEYDFTNEKDQIIHEPFFSKVELNNKQMIIIQNIASRLWK